MSPEFYLVLCPLYFNILLSHYHADALSPTDTLIVPDSLPHSPPHLLPLPLSPCSVCEKSVLSALR
jgi:hypothetical protein